MYFDVENAVQKKLNDSFIGDKTMVDSINNSFMGKFQQNIKISPELMARIEGQYKDYKSLRLRLALREGLTKLLPPRTDEVAEGIEKAVVNSI